MCVCVCVCVGVCVEGATIAAISVGGGGGSVHAQGGYICMPGKESTGGGGHTLRLHCTVPYAVCVYITISVSFRTAVKGEQS